MKHKPFPSKMVQTHHKKNSPIKPSLPNEEGVGGRVKNPIPKNRHCELLKKARQSRWIFFPPWTRGDKGGFEPATTGHTKKSFKIPLTHLLLISLILPFFLPILPVRATTDHIVISEIAWMGTTDFGIPGETVSNNEWIELQNPTNTDIDLTDWTLNSQDGTPKITLSGIIAAHSFFLLERSNDNTLPNITADQIFTGALQNNPTAEHLILTNSSGSIIQSLDFSGGWPAGDNSTKQTMSLTSQNTWQDSTDPNGTPRAPNFPTSPSLLSDPTDFQAQADNQQITFTWTQPTSASGTIILMDITQIPNLLSGTTTIPSVGTTFSGSTATVIFSDSGSTHTAINLPNDIPHFFRAHSFDPTNFSTGTSTSATPTFTPNPPPPPPPDLTNLKSIPGDQEITLTWNPPADPEIQVRITHSPDSSPTCTGGTLLFEGSANNASFTASGPALTNDTEHFFRLCTKDFTGNLSPGLLISDIPFQTPDIIFSEIAWAGSSSSNSDEWIELTNQTSEIIDLSAWTIFDHVKNQIMLTLPPNSTIGTGSSSIFLISHFDPSDSRSTLNLHPNFLKPSISLHNSTFHLSLTNSSGTTIDQAGNGSAPPAGDSLPQKISMHRLSPLKFGTLTSAWTGSTVSLGFDPGTPDLGTPGTGSDLIDTFPPAPVSDLQAIQAIQNSTGALLTFSPSFDDGFSGNFASQVSLFSGSNLLSTFSGSATSHFVPNAQIGSIFKLQSQDDQNLLSDFSNSATLFEDTTPPSLTFSPDPSDLIFGTGALPFQVTVSSDDIFAQISCTNSGTNILSASGSGIITLSDSATIFCTASDFMSNSTSDSKTFTFQPLTSQVIFSEILPNPKGRDADSEWMEFQNLTNQNISLSNWTVTDGSKTHTFTNSDFISPHGFFFLSKATSKITMGNYSDTETFTLTEPNGTISDTLTRNQPANDDTSFAFDPDSNSWRWTTTLTPGSQNKFTDPPSTGITHKTNPNPTSISDLTILITAISPKSSTHDFVTFTCLDCKPEGTDLGGWTIWDDGQIFEIPLGFFITQNQTFTLEFKAQLASDFSSKILRTSDSGLTSTDEQIILKDQDDQIENAVCWANQNGKFSSGEESQVATLISVQAWTGSLAAFDESICLDSSLLKSNQIFTRKNPSESVILNLIQDPDKKDFFVIPEFSERKYQGSLDSPNFIFHSTNSPSDWQISDPISDPKISKITLDSISKSQIIPSDFSQISLSEILPNPKGSDTDFEWLELQNQSDEPIPLSGLILQTSSSTFTFSAGEIPPDSFLQIPRKTFKFALKNSSGSLILKTQNQEILDQTNWQKSPENHSWAKIQNQWQWTSLLTPNSPNLPSHKKLPSLDGRGQIAESNLGEGDLKIPPLLDSDGDLIPDIFEQKIGTDPKTPDRTVASFSAWQKHLTSQTKITKLQTQPTSPKNPTPFISGIAPPGSKIHLTLHSKIITAVVSVGPDGTWSFTPETELEAGQHTVFFSVEDQNQVRTPWQKMTQFELTQTFLPPPHSLIISEIFPNPKGTDTPSSEWIELENFGDEAINLANWTLQDPKQKIAQLPDFIIPPHSFFQIPNSDLHLSFLNSRTNFVLKDFSGRTIHSLIFDDAIPDNQSLIFLTDSQEIKLTLKPTPNQPNLLEQKNSSQNPQTVSLSQIPDLKSGTWIQIQGTVLTPSHAFAKNQLWLTDGFSTLPLTSDSLPDFQPGDQLSILGRVSHASSQPQILTTHSESHISKVDTYVSTPSPTLLSKNPPPHTLISVSGSVLARERHFLTLDSGLHIDSFHVDDFPLLEAGDQLTVTGFTLLKNNHIQITPWALSQIQVQIQNPLLTSLSTLPTSNPQNSNSFPFFPLFGGILISGSALHLTKKKLKTHCLQKSACEKS